MHWGHNELFRCLPADQSLKSLTRGSDDMLYILCVPSHQRHTSPTCTHCWIHVSLWRHLLDTVRLSVTRSSFLPLAAVCFSGIIPALDLPADSCFLHVGCTSSLISVCLHLPVTDSAVCLRWLSVFAIVCVCVCVCVCACVYYLVLTVWVCECWVCV